MYELKTDIYIYIYKDKINTNIKIKKMLTYEPKLV